MREEQSKWSLANFSHIFSPFSSPAMISTVTNGGIKHSFFSFFLFFSFNPQYPQRRSDLHKRRIDAATIRFATISTVTTDGEDQMGFVMKNKKKKKKKSSEDQMGSVIKKKKKKRLRPSKVAPHVCCSDSRSLRVCLIMKMPLKTEFWNWKHLKCIQFP